MGVRILRKAEILSRGAKYNVMFGWIHIDIGKSDGEHICTISDHNKFLVDFNLVARYCMAVRDWIFLGMHDFDFAQI